jgi:hypothetical protein
MLLEGEHKKLAFKNLNSRGNNTANMLEFLHHAYISYLVFSVGMSLVHQHFFMLYSFTFIMRQEQSPVDVI